jgi:phage tail-like protein
MAHMRERPYVQFNFLVDLGNGNTEGPEAGFQEVSSLQSSLDTIEYRNGNSKVNSPIKLAGLSRTANVTLKRGLMGALSLHQWLDEARSGGGLRTVTISLQDEARANPVMQWRLVNARIVKHTSGPFNAKGNDVAIEEIEIACERLELE